MILFNCPKDLLSSITSVRCGHQSSLSYIAALLKLMSVVSQTVQHQTIRLYLLIQTIIFCDAAFSSCLQVAKVQFIPADMMIYSKWHKHRDQHTNDSVMSLFK